MTIKRGVTVDGQLVPNATGTLYTPPTGVTRAVISSAVFYANAAVTDAQVFVVPDGGTAGNANQVFQKTFAADESYTAPELIGQAIEANGLLQANDGGGGGTVLNAVITLTEFSGDS